MATTLKEIALRYSPLSNMDDDHGDQGKGKEDAHDIDSKTEIVEDMRHATSRESITTSTICTSIGLQPSAADISRNTTEANSVTSLPTTLLNSTTVKTSASSGKDRKLSLHDFTNKLYDSSTRKTSIPFGSSRKFSLHDISSTMTRPLSSLKTSLSVGMDRKLSLGDGSNHLVTSRKTSTISYDVDRKMLSESTSSVTCRICLDGEIPGEQLVNPCLCAGSASHVHITCLKKWLVTSGNNVCELCQYELDVGWKATSMWKALKELSHVRMTNRKICWALLVSIAALTLPLFCICIFVMDNENLRLQLSQPANMAVSYGVILLSCGAYLALLFMVAYLTWKWEFCPSAARCHFPTEIEIRVESLEERLKRGRTRRGGYHGNTTPILNNEDNVMDDRIDGMNSYWISGEGYL